MKHCGASLLIILFHVWECSAFVQRRRGDRWTTKVFSDDPDVREYIKVDRHEYQNIPGYPESSIRRLVDRQSPLPVEYMWKHEKLGEFNLHSQTNGVWERWGFSPVKVEIMVSPIEDKCFDPDFIPDEAFLAHQIMPSDGVLQQAERVLLEHNDPSYWLEIIHQAAGISEVKLTHFRFLHEASHVPDGTTLWIDCQSSEKSMGIALDHKENVIQVLNSFDRRMPETEEG